MTEKLIRDKLPELYGSSINDPQYRVADTSEMFDLLIAKLREETDELERSRELEELADILEIALALAPVLGVTPEWIERARQSKARASGGFEERIVWHVPD